MSEKIVSSVIASVPEAGLRPAWQSQSYSEIASSPVGTRNDNFVRSFVPT